ncbi:C-type lectin-like [Trinorchestia longiramus]|nr:C-type lectin-like [Trinorchestia longiramus]
MNFRVWPLLLAGITSGTQQKSTLLTFYKNYSLESDTSYIQRTHSGSMSECSSECHRYSSAGILYERSMHECTIFPSAQRLAFGRGVYIRDGWLIEHLIGNGYIRVGKRFVLPYVAKTEFIAIEEKCTQFVAFGTIFVPKSGEEMALLGQKLTKDQQGKKMWIGLNDTDQEGTPTWADGTAYTGLESMDPMRWKDNEDMKDNDDEKDGVMTEWKSGDEYWETKFTKLEDEDGVLCQVELGDM